VHWPRKRSPQAAVQPVPKGRVPAILVARSVRKALGAPGVTGAAVGLALGVIIGLALAAALLATRDE